MFAAFTIVACLLGWNIYLVQQRKDFIAQLPARAASMIRRDFSAPSIPLRHQELLERHLQNDQLDAVFLGPSKDQRDPFSHRVPYTTYQPTAPSALPLLRQWLGDQPYWFIACFPGPAAERARQLFPEATVYVADDPWPWPVARVRE
jgi:hypothetical protein